MMPVLAHHQNLLFDVHQVDTTLARIKHFEPPEGYYLAFSGGKDSVVLKALADMAGVTYDAHYNITTIDPPELVKFIVQEHGDVQRNRPEMSFCERMIHKRWPPMRHQRWCCEYFKEAGGVGRRILTGVRWEESARRRTRGITEQCYTKKAEFVHPIIDWTEEAVWGFIRDQGLPYCGLYDEGRRRLGCLMCPMAGASRLRDAERYPHYARRITLALAKVMELRAARGKPVGQFQTADEFFDWWIHDRSSQPADLPLFG